VPDSNSHSSSQLLPGGLVNDAATRS
jgi:hypothetical protein